MVRPTDGFPLLIKHVQKQIVMHAMTNEHLTYIAVNNNS